MELIKSFNGIETKIIINNGEPFFKARDVCNILGLKNVSMAISGLDINDVISSDVVDSIGKRQNMFFVSEQGLYDLIFKSRKIEAKQFQKWVTHEVLPSIRKTGKYSIPEKLKQISTKNRNELTDEWKNHGIDKPYHYVNLTRQEYKNLQIDKSHKKDFTEKELRILTAFELMESLKLNNNPEIDSYYECSGSLEETSKTLIDHIKTKEIK